MTQNYSKIAKIADEVVGSEGDHNSRIFANALVNLLEEAPLDEYNKVWKFVKPIIKKYNKNIFIPTKK